MNAYARSGYSLPNAAAGIAPAHLLGGYKKPEAPQPRNPFFRNEPPVAEELLPRDINSRYGRRLRELRRAQNMTQLQMAVYFGIDRSFISDVECGKKSISLCFLEVIALGLNISVAEMLHGL